MSTRHTIAPRDSVPQQLTAAWRPVSAEYPIHIRPLVGGGVEVAFYVNPVAPLDTEWQEGVDKTPADQVRRVAANLAAYHQ